MRVIAYQSELYQNQRKKNKRQKVEQVNETRDIVQNYFGAKFNMKLNETSHNMSKLPIVEQEMHRNKVPLLKKDLLHHEISFNETKQHLNMTFETPAQLASIIGVKNIARISKQGHTYSPNYPVKIQYKYQVKYPKLSCEISVNKKNNSNNCER